MSKQSWSLSVEKHRSSCGPECRVRGGPLRRGSSSAAPPRCLGPLLPSGPPGAPWWPPLKGLCPEPQWCTSFLGWEGLVVVGALGALGMGAPLGGAAGGLLPTPVLWAAAAAAAARDAW